MKQKFSSPIEELRHLMTLQLQAHLVDDEVQYQQLEEEIIRVEKKL